MRKQSFFLVPALSLMFLFTSCAKEEIKVEIGKEFKIENNPITIVKLEESKVIRATEDKGIKMAPKGKKYLYLEVKNPNEEMIFLKVFSNGQEIKAADDLYGYGHDVLDKKSEDAYYLVDENAKIDKIIITTPSEEQYTVMNPAVSKSKSSIPAEVQSIVDSYSKDKAIGLLEGFQPYVENGKNVHDIAKQEGQLTASNIMSNKAEVTDFTEDGKKYVFNIANVLGGSAKVTTYWNNGKITSIEVVE
ncbi:hypothetical protein [uncultured Chryseobacterium sp.]|uniref:hypothetical protein n=1 Tax=uncultured Chryseobacterium sp. TaxID=259322 RepID=UPI0025E80202|nr:hypothetical protein [uncultured Chryseobacterium sp.]